MKKPLDLKCLFSDFSELKEIQESCEKLNIYEVIKNIVNQGDPNQNIGGSYEWEGTRITYRPVFFGMQEQICIGKIEMQDGTILYNAD